MKEAVIVLGRRSGIANKELAEALGMDPSAATKGMEAAELREEENVGLRKVGRGFGDQRCAKGWNI